MPQANFSAKSSASKVLWIAVLMILVLALAGCAPRVGAGETMAAASAEDIVIDLPSIALDVAEDGSVSIGGIAIAELAGSLGFPLELPITADQVKQLTGAGIQHIQIANQPDGLGLVINGQAIPSLGWTDQELMNVAGLVPDMPALATLLPILTKLGIGVTMNLPVAEGAERAPLQVEAAGSAAEELAASQERFVEAVGSTPTISVPIFYDATGNYTVAGVSGEQWAALTGQSFWDSLNLTEANLNAMRQLGITKFDIAMDADGLHLVANGTALPYIDWSDGKLASVIALAESTGALNLPGLDPAMLDTILSNFLPILTSSAVNLSLNFPE